MSNHSAEDSKLEQTQAEPEYSSGHEIVRADLTDMFNDTLQGIVTGTARILRLQLVPSTRPRHTCGKFVDVFTSR